MQQNFLTLFLLLVLHQFPNILEAQEREILHLIPDTSTTFHWGAITVPLSNTSIKVPKDKFIEWQPIPPTEISINELLLSLRDRIFLYKDQQIVSDFKDLSLAFSPAYSTVQKMVKRGIPAKEAQKQLHAKRYTLKIAANEVKKLTETTIQKISSIIDHDTRITIFANDRKYMGHAILKATYAPYEPPAIVRHNKFELFKFQLLEPLEGPTLLRIDTTENKRVFDMYKSDHKTTIIHLPNFQTATRTAEEKYEQDLEKILKQPSSFPPQETLYLPEYIEYEPTNLTLSLGNLTAQPESRNYALATFNEQKGSLVLRQNESIFKIKNFRLCLYKKDRKWQTHSIRIDKKNKWLTHLDNLRPETSIYFDKLIIEKEGKSYYLGQAFLFKIGKDFLKE